MYKSLSEVAEGVHEVSEIFNHLSANSELSFDEKFKLFELFMSLKESDNYLKPFNEDIKAKQSQARQLWQEFTSLSNKLDYMDIDSDEFKMLDKQCDATKSEYDEISKDIAKLHDELRHRKSSVAAFAYFDPSLYSLLLTRIGQIANSILLDLAKLNPNIGGKEGDK
jgi:peptidoglycan hydrolase CwlO-like protein